MDRAAGFLLPSATSLFPVPPRTLSDWPPTSRESRCLGWYVMYLGILYFWYSASRAWLLLFTAPYISYYLVTHIHKFALRSVSSSAQDSALAALASKCRIWLRLCSMKPNSTCTRFAHDHLFSDKNLHWKYYSACNIINKGNSPRKKVDSVLRGLTAA